MRIPGRLLVDRKLVAFCFAIAAAMTVSAHPGHRSVLSTDELATRATSHIGRLVDEGKLDASWKTGAELQTVEKNEHGESIEYMVVFTNPGATDPGQKTLYVFLTATGGYIAANFSGR